MFKLQYGISPSRDQIISMNKIRHWFEMYGFEVSNRLADRLGMKVKNVRLFFIYASFATFGGFFGLYLTLAFWMKMKDMIYTKRTSVFDL